MDVVAESRYRFSPHAGGTRVELRATIPLDGIAALAAPLAIRGVKRGMDANRNALKAGLEVTQRR